MKQDIEKSLHILKSGGTLCYPTDTIWGIGCDATNEEAVNKIFSIKNRNAPVPLIILVDSDAMVERYVQDPPEIAFDIIELSQKPITVIFEKGINLPSNVIGADGSIGIRVCKEPFVQELIQKFRRPIISTSANIHGEPAPDYYDEISEEILSGVDYIVTYRQDDRTAFSASSIVKINNNAECTIIRK
ncbi:MAG: L-threonylcarbamoyladenylate synthase [Bacteroidales bacterium]|jgi:L-threonylcarbamoyladenylate synthase|nr:L-threonylcarbamoyladenylate synthase [Bacteroidales bacterium]